MSVTPAPYGTWRSPLTARALAGASMRLGGVGLEGGRVHWIEGRPEEGGRQTLMRLDGHGAARELTPAPYSVRSRVHEYGGAAALVAGDRAWFCNDADQRLYALDAGAAPRALTPEGPWRYADPVLDTARRRLICVREAHDRDPPRNEIAAVSLDDGAVRVLAAGDDFVASPTLSPDGRRLAWIAWNQPDMPWDAAALWVADVAGDGAIADARRVAGGDGVAVFQPGFAADGTLWFVADPDGWWNLHRARDGTVERVLAMRAEFGLPLWQLGMRTWGFDGAGGVVCAWCRDGAWRLGRLDPRAGALADVACPYTSIGGLAVEGHRAAFVGAAADRPAAVVSVDLDAGAWTVHRASVDEAPDPAAVSVPERLGFATGDGERAHALLYRPRNPAHRAPPGERPPLVVVGHGGPTGATSDAYRPALQFWTSRGFAVLDVDYRGSTGYGRAYRERLYGGWGVVDVEDCVAGARHCVEAGLADGARLAIRGSSAGGYTTLAALVFHDAFRAGASWYGISDLEVLAADTHKFEARYLDRLVGPYPEARAVYRARSPIHFAERLACPVIFFQGTEDRVVPPAQAERMVDALRARGLPVAYLAFEGEQHGFRRAGTIARAHEAELYFYGRVFGFEPADAIEPVAIENP